MLEFQESLKDSGLPVEHFDGVIADPATDVVTAGVNMAKNWVRSLIQRLQ